MFDLYKILKFYVKWSRLAKSSFFQCSGPLEIRTKWRPFCQPSENRAPLKTEQTATIWIRNMFVIPAPTVVSCSSCCFQPVNVQKTKIGSVGGGTTFFTRPKSSSKSHADENTLQESEYSGGSNTEFKFKFWVHSNLEHFDSLIFNGSIFELSKTFENYCTKKTGSQPVSRKRSPGCEGWVQIPFGTKAFQTDIQTDKETDRLRGIFGNAFFLGGGGGTLTVFQGLCSTR